MATRVWRADSSRISKQESKRLTEKELAGYRQQLAELAETAAKPGGDLTTCDEETARYFGLNTAYGKQVYESFSDEELMDVVVKLIDHQGHKLNYASVYCIYKDYIRKRFGSLPNAASKARTELKLRKNKAKWPPNWPEGVSLQALLDAPRNQRKLPSAEDLSFLKRLCETAKRTGYPPSLTSQERQRIEKLGLGSLRFVLETMGIPCLDKIEFKHIKRYWDMERKKSGGYAKLSVAEEEEHE